MGKRIFLFLVFLFFTLNAAAFGQSVLPPLPGTLFDFAAAADPGNQTAVVFGGAAPGGDVSDVTFIFDFKSQKWNTSSLASRPLGRTRCQMAYLPKIKRIVLFGGLDAKGAPLNDTWIFDGKAWEEIKTKTRPAPRASHGLCATGDGEVLVLFGGVGEKSSELGDTWLFDGKRWSQEKGKKHPSPRSMTSMATDYNQGGILLYGGWGPSENALNEFSDTWRFAKKKWALIEKDSAPGTRSGAMMPSLPGSGTIWIIGGHREGKELKDSWKFENDKWTLQSAMVSEGQLSDLKPVIDPIKNEIVFIAPDSPAEESGEMNPAYFLGTTWQWDGKDWEQISSETNPAPRALSKMVYESFSNRMLMFGGHSQKQLALNDTWSFDGSKWQTISTKSSPEPRYAHQMVADEKGRRTVLFGGYAIVNKRPQNVNDTWVFQDAQWTKLNPKTSPSPRSGHFLVYDPKRNATWLFGGYGPKEKELNDLWKLSGDSWQKIDTASPPSPRFGAAAAFFPKDGNIYVFGGENKSSGSKADTWQFNPKKKRWKLIKTKSAPNPRFSAEMIYDETLGELVLFGGFVKENAASDIWAFNGKNWRQIPTLLPEKTVGFVLGRDMARHNTILFGGFNVNALSIGSAQKNEKKNKIGTYEFDGQTWKKIETVHSPTAELSYSLAYDPTSKKVVLFGGYHETLGEVNETWEYDGKDWKKVDTQQNPMPRTNPSLIWDPKRKSILCFGGYNPIHGPLNDLWEYNGKTWKQLSIQSPYANYTGGTIMVYDSQRKVFVLYGGKESK